MTFEEALNSGCRFRLPYGYEGCGFTNYNAILHAGSWPEGFYWVKVSETHISYGLESNDHRPIKPIDVVFNDFRSLKEQAMKSDKWYLHPGDTKAKHDREFNKKLLGVINE